MICPSCDKEINGSGVESLELNKWFCSRTCLARAIKETDKADKDRDFAPELWCSYCELLVVGSGTLEGGKDGGKYYHPVCYDMMQTSKTAEQVIGNAVEMGVKYDEGKLPYHLISPYAMDGLAERLQHGMSKYAERNWENGLDWSRCYRAALNHLFAWWRGEDVDSDSGLPHIDAALCNLMFLSHYTRTGGYAKYDNRPGSKNPKLPKE